jgi:hypothetical protein
MIFQEFVSIDLVGVYIRCEKLYLTFHNMVYVVVSLERAPLCSTWHVNHFGFTFYIRIACTSFFTRSSFFKISCILKDRHALEENQKKHSFFSASSGCFCRLEAHEQIHDKKSWGREKAFKSGREMSKRIRQKRGTNKIWNAETIWILSPLIPFFIPHPEGATLLASFRI